MRVVEVHALRVIVQFLSFAQSSCPVGAEPGWVSIEGGKKGESRD